MNIQKTRHELKNGPSKWDLIIEGLGNGKPVIFVAVTGATKMRVRITSVSIEDGSNESWIFKGHTLAPDSSSKTLARFQSGDVEGYWHTKLRRGWIAEA